jgi:hypothetical protein
MNTRAISTATLLLTLAMSTTAIGATATPLQVETLGNVAYVSGGVGVDERDRLTAMSQDDNLRLSFAMPDGEFLGGAEVNIKDNHGSEVLDAPANGPLFFAKLPAGNYTVEATTMGRTLARTVTVPAKGQASVYFIWRIEEQRQARR